MNISHCPKHHFSILWGIPVSIAVTLSPILDTVIAIKDISSSAGLLNTGQLIGGVLLVLLLMPLFINELIQRGIWSHQDNHFVDTKYIIAKSPLIPLLWFVIYGILVSAVGGNFIDGIIYFSKILYLILVSANVILLVQLNILGRKWLLCSGAIIIIMILSSQIIGYATGIRAYGSDYSFVGLTGKATAADQLMALTPLFFLSYTSSISLTLFPMIIILISSVAFMRRSAVLVNGAVAILTILVSYRSSVNRFHIVSRIVRIIPIIFTLTIVLLYTKTGYDFSQRLPDLNIFDGGTASGRLIFIPITWNHILDRPPLLFLTGEGVKNIMNMMWSNYGIAIGSHNLWIDIIYSFGMIGGSIYLWFNIRLVKMSYYAMDDTRAAAFAATLCVILSALVAGRGFGATYAPLYALIGYTAAVNSQRIPAKQE